MISLFFLCIAFSESGQLFSSYVEKDHPHFQEVSYQKGLASSLSLPANTRYLVIDLRHLSLNDQQRESFELKQLIINLKSQTKGLKVGLQGSPKKLDAVNKFEISGYVDAYTYTDQPYIPKADSTAQLWWRTAIGQGQTLQTLLAALSQGVQLVVFEHSIPDKGIRPLLEKLEALPVGDLDDQPWLVGLDKERTRFFLNPDDGKVYLFLQPQLASPLKLNFQLQTAHQARLLHPQDVAFSFSQDGTIAKLEIAKPPTYLLFEFTPQQYQRLETTGIVVNSQAAIDPYQIVAENQVFRERSQKEFESMDATEKIHVYPVATGEANFTWVERMIVRKGKPTEYYDMELLINGTPYPQKKQREEYIIGPGRFNSKALDLDLDLSYRYAYKGTEKVSGRDCWKIAFEPKADGRFAKGMVWIDQQTHAHLKMDVALTKPEAPFSVFEYTSFFRWKSDGTHRFFICDRIEGKVVLTILGFLITVRVEAEVIDPKFNREDIDEIVAAAYQSDLRIIRETDDGPRYMVKPNHRATRRRRANTKTVTDTKDRVMVDPSAFASEKTLVMGVAYDSHSEEVEPLLWFDYLNQDFLGKGYTLFAGPGIVGLSNPSLFGSNNTLTGFVVAAPGGGDTEYRQGVAIDETELDHQFFGAGVSLSTPLGKNVTLMGTYEVAFNKYDKGKKTAANFVVPSDMQEHSLQLDVAWHTRFFALNSFYQQSKRSEWTAWGYDAVETVGEDFSKAGLSIESSFDFLENQTLSYGVSLLSGSDLDRFSRFELGEEADVSGFGDIFTFDDAAVFHLDYNTQLGRYIPLQLGLDAGRLRLPETGDNEVDLVGLSIGTLFHGPWKTDIGLELGYGVHSSRKLDKDSYTISLSFHRRF